MEKFRDDDTLLQQIVNELIEDIKSDPKIKNLSKQLVGLIVSRATYFYGEYSHKGLTEQEIKQALIEKILEKEEITNPIDAAIISIR